MKMARGVYELANNMNGIRDIGSSNHQVDETNNKFLRVLDLVEDPFHPSRTSFPSECQLMDCLRNQLKFPNLEWIMRLTITR